MKCEYLDYLWDSLYEEIGDCLLRYKLLLVIFVLLLIRLHEKRKSRRIQKEINLRIGIALIGNILWKKNQQHASFWLSLSDRVHQQRKWKKLRRFKKDVNNQIEQIEKMFTQLLKYLWTKYHIEGILSYEDYAKYSSIIIKYFQKIKVDVQDIYDDLQKKFVIEMNNSDLFYHKNKENFVNKFDFTDGDAFVFKVWLSLYSTNKI